MIGVLVCLVIASLTGLALRKLELWQHPADNDPDSARNKWTGTV